MSLTESMINEFVATLDCILKVIGPDFILVLSLLLLFINIIIIYLNLTSKKKKKAPWLIDARKKEKKSLKTFKE